MKNVLIQISGLKNDLSLTRFCQDVGLNYEKLKKAFQRDTFPDAETLFLIANHFHIDLQWLVSGHPKDSSFHQAIGQRLVNVRMEKRWSQAQMASFLGLSETVLQWYEAGSGAISLLFLSELKTTTGDHLFNFNPNNNVETSPRPELRVIIPENMEKGPPLRQEDYVSIPLTGSAIAAGQPIIQENNIEDYVLLHIRAAGKRTNLVASRVDGDSMEPVLHSGDIIVIDRNDKTIARNKMYAVFYEEGLTAKYLEQQEGWLILRPINPNSQVQIIRLDEQPDPVVGRIIGSWKEF